MKITFIQSTVTNPYCHKRIGLLNRLGADVQCLAFDRRYWEEKKYGYACIVLGKIKSGRYLGRLLPMLRAIPIIRSCLRTTNVAYVFGLDMLLLSLVSAFGLRKKPRFVFDVCDIHRMLVGNSAKSIGLRSLERLAVSKVFLVVASSRAFVTEYYEKIQRLVQLRYMVIENKLVRESMTSAFHLAEYKSNCVLHIGYFGVIRCPRSLDILKEAARIGNGRIQVYIRGIPMGQVGDLAHYAKESPHIEYGGSYLSPDDLPEIYGRVDIVWACYPYQDKLRGNWMWARTNRFYEACFFKKPMFAQSNAQDGQVVTEKDLGVCLDLSDTNGCIERILSVGPADLHKWGKNLDQLPEKIYCYTDEHERLLNVLNTTD